MLSASKEKGPMRHTMKKIKPENPFGSSNKVLWAYEDLDPALVNVNPKSN